MSDQSTTATTALKESAPAGAEHKLFEQFVGTWEGTTQTWFEPDVLGDTGTTRGTIDTLFDGRFLRHEYEGSLVGYRMRGLAITGYNAVLSRYEQSWIDTCHNGGTIMFLTGDGIGEGTGLLGSYPDPGGGPSWSWRVEYIATSPTELTIRMYNISPEGREALAVETSYRRVR